MKKILFITHYSGVGGANISMVHLINNLREMGDVEPMVYIPLKGPIESTLNQYGIPYEIHRYISWRTKDKGMIHNAAQLIAMVLFNLFLTLKLLFKARRYDILYANSSKVIFSYFLKLFVRKPLIWHLREFGTIDYPMKYLLPKCIVGKVLGQSDILVAISNEILNYYKNNYCENGNYVMVYNGVENRDFYSPSIVKDDNPIRICLVGGFNESKNQIDLINSTDYLNLKNLQIDLYGDCETEYGIRLIRMVKEKNLVGTVNFKGQYDKINEVLPKYHIGIITSEYEAFGRVIVEYMLSGLAVIASDRGACPELIDHGHTGLLYKLGDSEDLANKIKDLINNKDKRDALASNAMSYANENLTAKINASNILKIINKL